MSVCNFLCNCKDVLGIFECNCVLQVLRKLSMLLQTSRKLSVITLDECHDKFGKNCHDCIPVPRKTSSVSNALL